MMFAQSDAMVDTTSRDRASLPIYPPPAEMLGGRVSWRTIAIRPPWLPSVEVRGICSPARRVKAVHECINLSMQVDSDVDV